MAHNPLLYLLLLASACGSEAPIPERPERAITLSPTRTMLPVTQHWAERWSEASGITITVGEGGVPIDLVTDIPHPDGSQRSGWTAPDRSRIEVHYRSPDVSASLGHELGHLLGADEHTDTDGVLGGLGHGRVIDVESLDLACAAGCPAFNPERW